MTESPPYRVLPALVALLALSGAARAQSPLYTFVGDDPDDSCGYSARAAGDVDGDGVTDVVVGSPRADPNGLGEAGAARVYSGFDGSLLRTLEGTSSGARLGHSVACAGDVDGDGFDDVLVGSPYETHSGGTEAGRVQVFSGFDGSLLNDHPGTSNYDRLGWSVAGLGDLDADGFDDYAAGAPRNTAPASAAGYVRVYSGDDGSVLWPLSGSGYLRAFGYSIGAAGDVDGDGVGDLIVGEPGHDAGFAGQGRAVVYSGASGSTVWIFQGTGPSHLLGWSVDGAGDLDGDGYADVIVGAVQYGGTGYARVYSGLTGGVLLPLVGTSVDERFGSEVSGAGDFDGDGTPDVIVSADWSGASGLFSGAVRVFSGSDASLLCELLGGGAFAYMGADVDGLGDLDGDGLDDIVVGIPGYPSEGSAEVHLGRCLPAAPISYCTAKANSLGCKPHVLWSGTPSLTGPDDFHVKAEEVLNNKPGLFFWGTAPTAVPFYGGTRCVASPARRTKAQKSGGTPPPADDCTGAYDWHFSQAYMTSKGLSPGSVLYGQYWSRDPGFPWPNNVGLTDALQFTICP